MNKKILFLILLLAVVAPTVTFAESDFVKNMVDGAVRTTFYIADGIIVILWVVAGLLFLLAQGAPEKLKTAKTAVLAAVAGTVLVIVANFAVYLVKDAFNLTLPTT